MTAEFIIPVLAVLAVIGFCIYTEKVTKPKRVAIARETRNDRQQRRISKWEKQAEFLQRMGAWDPGYNQVRPKGARYIRPLPVVKPVVDRWSTYVRPDIIPKPTTSVRDLDDDKATMFRQVMKRANRSGIPFTLTMATMPDVPELCPECGTWMERGLPLYNSPSLDKIVPSLGYTPGNVQVMCHGCNASKGDRLTVPASTNTNHPVA